MSGLNNPWNWTVIDPSTTKPFDHLFLRLVQPKRVYRFGTKTYAGTIVRVPFRISLWVLFCTASAVSANQPEPEYIYVEQISKDKYLVEVREWGADGWPDLKQTVLLNSKVPSESEKLKDFTQRSKVNSQQILGNGAELKSASTVPLWSATNIWSEQWENKYSEWITTEVDISFFERYQIATDCADIIYAARWIFSRIYNLPAAFELAGTGALFTNRSVRKDWLKLPTHSLWHKDKKFLASLNYLLEQTNTVSLMTAGYPVAINLKSFSAGAYRVRMNPDGDSRHAFLYNKISGPPSNEYPILNIQSTVPREVRKLRQSAFDTTEHYGERSEGIQRIRWAMTSGTQVKILPSAAHPSYSEEQFDQQMFPRNQWALKILQAINPNFDESWMVKVARETMVQNMTERVRIVEEGFEFCQKSDCSPGTQAYENWSTPSRDRKMMEYYRSYLKYVGHDGLKQTVTIKGKEYPLYFLYSFWQHVSSGSSDPREPIEERWGFFPEQMSERINILLREETQKRLILLQNTSIESDERKAIDRKIYDTIQMWMSFYIYPSYSSEPVRAVLSEILKIISTKNLVLNGMTRPLRHWIAFFSAASTQFLGPDAWGESLGYDWKVGAFGESVFSVDTKKHLTLTRHFLIDENSYDFRAVDRVTGPIRPIDANKHVIAIGNTLLDWDSNSTFECSSKISEAHITAVYNSDFILCGDKVVRNTAAGFQLFGKSSVSAKGLFSEGLSLATGINLFEPDIDQGTFISEDGSLLQFHDLLAVTEIFRTKGHLILRKGVRWIAIDIKSGFENEVGRHFHDPEGLTLMTHYFSDVVLMKDRDGYVWKLNLSQGKNMVPQLLIPHPVEGASALSTSRLVLNRYVGYLFLVKNSDRINGSQSPPYFSFLWTENQTFEFSHGLPEMSAAIVPTQGGFEFCSGQASYRVDSRGLIVTRPDRCHIQLTTLAITREPLNLEFRKATLLTNTLMTDLFPALDSQESWNQDYIPTYRTLDLTEGAIWVRNN